MTSASGPAHTVLIVDDDDDIRDALGEFLEDEGYAVTGAANGLEALSLLRAGPPPCVVLLDLMMPVMDGYEFRAEQARDPEVARIPVIIVTAKGSVDKSRAAGAAVLHKPLNLPKLMAALEQHC